MRKTRVGGKNSAKRKINIRKFLKSSQKNSFSDPFIDDESEVEKFALNFEPSKFSIHLHYKENDNEDSDDTDPDGILIEPDLEEAEKFISSLNLSKKLNDIKQTKPKYKYVETIPKTELDAFKAQCDCLLNLKNEEYNEDSDPDENLI